MGKRKTKHMKLPNGFGSISKMSGNRRNEFRVYAPARVNEFGKIVQDTIGYTDDWYKGYNMLKEFNDNPYDLSLKNTTFENIYKEIEKMITKAYHNKEKGMSKSNYNGLIGAYKKCKNIENKPIIELRKKDYQQVLDESNVGYTSKGYIKNLFNRIILYASDDLELPLKFKDVECLKIGEKPISNLHKPFTLDSIKKLWANSSNFYIRLIIILLYTGMRPSELLEMEKENVFLEENYMIGGLKTDAGKRRFIPIHPIIKTFIEELYISSNNKYLITLESTDKKLQLRLFEKKIKLIFEQLELDYTPYDARHTFATRADECGISETNIKVLMGHKLTGDVTNSVYIHKNKDYLLKEIKKLYYIKEVER